MRFNAQLYPRSKIYGGAANTVLEAALGYQDDTAPGHSWRLVKAKTAITAPANKLHVFTVTAGAISWAVKLSSTLSTQNAAGVGDPGASGNAAAGDYYWLQRRGEPGIFGLSTITAIGNLVGSKTTTLGSIGKYALPAATSAVVDQVSKPVGVALAAFATVATPVKVRLINIH